MWHLSHAVHGLIFDLLRLMVVTFAPDFIAPYAIFLHKIVLFPFLRGLDINAKIFFVDILVPLK